MSRIKNRQAVVWFSVACLQMILAVELSAQNPQASSSGIVEVPTVQLDAIQKELKYLRDRDAQRQVWEQSVVSQLMQEPFELAGHRTYLDPTTDCAMSCDSVLANGCDGQLAGCDGSSWGSHCGCGGCGCHLCERPLAPAPCIECPRVSTLAPFFNVSFFGALKLDMLFNSARAITPGTPFFLSPGSVAGFDQNSLSMHARQSTLGAAFTGPKMGNLQAGGAVIVMFFNDAVISDTYGLLPLQAYGDLKNENWRVAGGLMFDVFAPGLPTVLPFSALAASGNAGNSFRGQLRLERFIHLSDNGQLTIQGALSDPITTTVDSKFRLDEDNGWPNLEGRAALGLGELAGAGLLARRPFEVGVSGIVGQIRTVPTPIERVVTDVWGTALDFRWQLNQSFGFKGEVFTGQGIGTYNAGILQNIDPRSLQAVQTTGGFLETYLYWTPCLHTHIGYGVDDPRDQDFSMDPISTATIYNSTIFANVLWDLNKVFRIGFEFTQRSTNYKSPLLPDNDGTGFHTQLQWSF